jgi:hypothetical protein
MLVQTSVWKQQQSKFKYQHEYILVIEIYVTLSHVYM